MVDRMKAVPAIQDAIARSSDEATLLRHLHTWFDALRTVQLLHAIRDGGIPSIGYLQALHEAPFTGLTASTAEDTEDLRRALLAEERTLPAVGSGLHYTL